MDKDPRPSRPLQGVNKTLNQTLYGKFTEGLIDFPPVLFVKHPLLFHRTPFLAAGGSMRVPLGFLPGLDSIRISPSSLKALSPFHFCCLVMPNPESPMVVRVMESVPYSIIFSLKTSPTLIGEAPRRISLWNHSIETLLWRKKRIL